MSKPVLLFVGPDWTLDEKVLHEEDDENGREHNEDYTRHVDLLTQKVVES